MREIVMLRRRNIEKSQTLCTKSSIAALGAALTSAGSGVAEHAMRR